MANVLISRGKAGDEMKAVRFHEYGGPEVLSYEKAPVPKVLPGEALVKVKAAAVNRFDLWIEQGKMFKVDLPHIPGSDMAGIVEEISGSADEGLVGRKVVAYPVLSCFHCRHCIEGNHNRCLNYRYLGREMNGSYAEYAAIPVKNLVQMPPNLSFQEAAALPVAFMTAHHMLNRKAKLHRDETVLVLGAGGGIGTASIQIANIIGADVIAAASTEDKLRRASRLGADTTINYAENDLIEEVMSVTNNRGVDVVIDPIGSATFNKSLSCLAKNGRLIVCGITTGSDTTVNLRDIYMGQREVIGAITATMHDFLAVMELAGQRKIRAVIDSLHPFSEAVEAQKRMLSREAFGKIVLTS